MGDRSENLAFGQRIRAAMAVARVSRQDVARACGTSPQGVQRWCDGTSYPSSSKLITFCNMTGCSAEWLLWPHPVDIRSTDWAINGTHIKNIVRQAMDDLAAEQSTPPITPDADTAELAKLRERAEKAEQERVAEWNRRRDADGSRDAARAACDTMRAERDTLAASPEVKKLVADAEARGMERAAQICAGLADQVSDAALTGLPEQARLRESMEAAFTKARHAIRAEAAAIRREATK